MSGYTVELVDHAGAIVARAPFTVQTPPAGMQSLAFWLGWDGSVTEAQVPWDALTQVCLFAVQTKAGTGLDLSQLSTVPSVPAWVDMVHRHGKTALISVGGIDNQHWDVATNSTNRAGFVRSLIDYMVTNGFDGIDIDVEQYTWGAIGPPSPPWTAAVKAIADAAHAATTKAGRPGFVTTDIDQSWMIEYLAPFAGYVDQINLMAYQKAATTAQMDTQVKDLLTTGKASSAKRLLMGFMAGGDPNQTVTVAQATTIARWASTSCGGVMIWDLQEDVGLKRTAAVMPYVKP